MTYNSAAPLHRGGRTGMLVFSGSDSVYNASTPAAGDKIDDPTPGVASSGYPGYTRATGGSFLTAGFAVGHHVRVTGAAADANGSTTAPKLWRIAYLTALTMGVEGVGSASITTVAASAAYIVRRVRLFRVADVRSINGAAHPLTLQATTSTSLTGTVLHASLDNGVTWDALPGIALPDTANSNAKILQFFVGYEALLMVVPGTGFAGNIYAG